MKYPRIRGVSMACVLALIASVAVAAVSGRAETAIRAGTITFIRSPPGTGTVGALFVMNADGTGLRRLSSPDSAIEGHAWSPDGSLIAYTDRDSLWLVRPDGTRRLQLFARPAMRGLTLTWSPDGKAIAVQFDANGKEGTTAKEGTTESYVVPTDGSAPHRIGTATWQEPSWSPRGDRIAYGSNGAIWTVRSDGSDVRPVARPPHRRSGGYWGGPSWSSTGWRLAFRGGNSKDGRYALIYVVNADGSGLRRLTKHGYNEYGFRWSPDGRRILYGKENSRGIFVIGADGRHDRRITTDSPAQTVWGALTWSPDGHSIAYATDRTGNGDIYVIGANGRNKVRLTSSSDEDIDPAWAPRCPAAFTAC
jgi:Tol biopolymer transport system component